MGRSVLRPYTFWGRNLQAVDRVGGLIQVRLSLNPHPFKTERVRHPTAA